MPVTLNIPKQGTRVNVLNYGATVEIVFQGTNVVAGIDHPMHLHGFSFHVVGYGLGNFNQSKDPLNFNLVDPPYLNTVIVPVNGWAAIRFVATNPGMWLGILAYYIDLILNFQFSFYKLRFENLFLLHEPHVPFQLQEYGSCTVI